jgi:hypothetical protein
LVEPLYVEECFASFEGVVDWDVAHRTALPLDFR